MGNYKWSGIGKPIDLRLLGRHGCAGGGCPFTRGCSHFRQIVDQFTLKTIGKRNIDNLWWCPVFKQKE